MKIQLKRRLLPALFFAALGGTGLVMAQTVEPDLTSEAARFDSVAVAAPDAATRTMATNFTTLAGSEDNAAALVAGLREGSAITFDDGVAETADVTITPSAPMGYGNVFITLAVAQKTLADAGITEPTLLDVKTALEGGDIQLSETQTLSLAGILKMRAEGMGWGEIAKAGGFKLGPVISAIRSGNARLEKSQRAAAETRREVRGQDLAATKAERVGKAERAERPEKMERIERAERPDRPEKPERPEKIERPGRG